MTYSIGARCMKTGGFGIAITSSSICVASRCAWVGPLGAVLTQNVTDPALGPCGLTLLRQGLGANAVLQLLRDGTPEPEWRQIGVIDRYGVCGVHSGSRAMPKSGFKLGRSCVAIGNLLSSSDVPERMVQAFEANEQLRLEERLLMALEAGLDAGGENDDEHAAGLHVAEAFDWPVVDLRVDWRESPIRQLRELWRLYETQRPAYEARARTPDLAPGF